MTASTLFAVPRASGPLVAREHTFYGKHPDPLPAHVAGPGCVLVDDPMAYPIQRGDATLNWEGDDRLALYANVRQGRWVLVRLERDGVYRVVVTRRMIELRGPELVVSLIIGLVARDVRRGFDAHAHIVAQNEAVDRAVARSGDAAWSERNDKLRWALKRDGAGDHCTGL